MKPPGTIVNLAEKNQSVLDKLNFNPDLDDPYELCTPEAYTQTGIFTKDMVSEIFGPQRQAQNNLEDIPKHIGMILIRPDMLHASGQFEDYIKQRFTIKSSDQIELTSDTYWNLYKHDLYRRKTMHSRLTRALIYIGSPSRLIVFSDKDRKSNVHLADHVKHSLRGDQGIYSPNTLRGDVVYTNAVKLGAHLLDNTVDSRIKLALDPFSAYRALARKSTGQHVGLVHPLLFYTGVGVHVPDSLEIKSDLPETLALASTRLTEAR